MPVKINKQIQVIEKFFEYKCKEKGSLFIAQCYPVTNEDEANNILEKIRKKYYDATHHCFAWKLIDGKFKYSDDGEPNGSAGIRILNAIEHFSLTDLLVVVIRYFGGTKLGIGPLGRIYYESTYYLLSSADILTKNAYKQIFIKGDYHFSNLIYKRLSDSKSLIKKNLTTNIIQLEVNVLVDELEKLKLNLINDSGGKILVEETDEIIYE